MIPYIDEIYASRKVIGVSGIPQVLHSNIDRFEGAFLANLIEANIDIAKTLEIGCAFGLSSLYICHSIAGRTDAQHTIIDPFQYAYWDGVGVNHLKKTGIDFFKLVEKKSEFALPEILSQGESAFDLVFIDGWHTFDHALLDCFYSTRLLRNGGYLVIDDCQMPSVRRVMDYLLSYPCYNLHAGVDADYAFESDPDIPKTLNNLHQIRATMVALRKTCEDKRSWNWYPERIYK